MTRSILQERKECFLTHRTDRLHRHHIYAGSRRAASEKWGCWVWLTAEKHTLSGDSAHQNPMIDRMLKRVCQRRFETLYGRETFIKVFGKNYLEESAC